MAADKEAEMFSERGGQSFGDAVRRLTNRATGANQQRLPRVMQKIRERNGGRTEKRAFRKGSRANSQTEAIITPRTPGQI